MTDDITTKTVWKLKDDDTNVSIVVDTNRRHSAENVVLITNKSKPIKRSWSDDGIHDALISLKNHVRDNGYRFSGPQKDDGHPLS